MAAEAGYAAQNVVPPCENLDYHPSLKPEEAEVGKGAYNSTMVTEPKLYEVPMQSIYLSSAMQKEAEPGDCPKN